MDVSLFEMPYMKFRYFEEIGDFDYDIAYAKKMESEIEAFRNGIVVTTTKTENEDNPGRPYTRISNPHTTEPDTKVITRSESPVESTANASENLDGVSETQSRPLFFTEEKPADQTDSREYLKIKGDYPPGKTIEDIQEDGKKITRVILKKRGSVEAYIKVVHHWGGVFYFYKEPSSNLRSITEHLFERALRS